MSIHSKKISKRKTVRIPKERLDALHDFIENEMGETICPVTLENYDFENPPFLTDTCGHSFSLDALKKLKISTTLGKNNKQLKVMQCPLCRRDFHFANLHFSYFQLRFISENLQEGSETSIKREEFSEQVKRLPLFFTPVNGCLSF